MNVSLRDETLNSLIAGIYDCAIDGSGWTECLGLLAAEINVDVATVSIVDLPYDESVEKPGLRLLTSPWQVDVQAMVESTAIMTPMCHRWQTNDLDRPESAVQILGAPAYHASDFFKAYCEPLGQFDTCTTTLVRRPHMLAMLSASTRTDQGQVSETQRAMLRLLAPHFRRALLISDLLEERRDERTLYQAALDSLNAGIILVDEDARILHANRAANAHLGRNGALSDVSGRLWTYSVAHRQALLAAIRRACLVPEAVLGTWGSGIALAGPEGNQIAAYVLPLGRSERRNSLGPGRAAIFVTDKEGKRPPPVEVLSALSGLTTAESRVAQGIADGTPLETLAVNLGISLHTLRKHLANAYEKTGQNSQAALGAYVNRLRMPIA